MKSSKNNPIRKKIAIGLVVSSSLLNASFAIAAVRSNSDSSQSCTNYTTLESCVFSIPSDADLSASKRLPCYWNGTVCKTIKPVPGSKPESQPKTQ